MQCRKEHATEFQELENTMQTEEESVLPHTHLPWPHFNK